MMQINRSVDILIPSKDDEFNYETKEVEVVIRKDTRYDDEGSIVVEGLQGGVISVTEMQDILDDMNYLKDKL